MSDQDTREPLTREELNQMWRQAWEDSFEPNEHGVSCRRVGYGLIPRCCIECSNYDGPEYIDGYYHSGPWCMKNVFWPTRKGTCKWQNKR